MTDTPNTPPPPPESPPAFSDFCHAVSVTTIQAAHQVRQCDERQGVNFNREQLAIVDRLLREARRAWLGALNALYYPAMPARPAPSWPAVPLAWENTANPQRCFTERMTLDDMRTMYPPPVSGLSADSGPAGPSPDDAPAEPPPPPTDPTT